MKDSFTEDTEGLLSKDDLGSGESSRSFWQNGLATSKWSLRDCRPSPLPVVILCLTNIATLAILFSTIPSIRARQTCPALNHPPTGVAPTLAHLASEPKPELFNVTFYPHDNPFRQRNSVEADILWEEYTQSGEDTGFIMIPRGEEAAADINPSRHAYVDRPDIGMVGYPVLPEAIHEMHCVDKLRQNLYYNIEHTRKSCKHNHCVSPEMEGWEILHVDHCLEILRRRVACTADLGIIPFMWYRSSGKLTGDSIRMHTCGDYDAIKRFTAENSVKDPPLGSPEGLKPPEDQFILEEYD